MSTEAEAAVESVETEAELEAGEKPVEGSEPGEDESGEVVVSIGDPVPPTEDEDETKAAPWVREVRKTNREQARRIRELEAAAAAATAAAQVKDPGTKLRKPSMQDPDIDFDADKFETRFEAWKAQEEEAAEGKRKEQEALQKEKNAWQAKLEHYGTGKTALKVPDFDDAEATAISTLSPTQQAIIVKGAANPATLVYALGKNPAEAKKLAAITDPVEFAFAAAKLEAKLSITPRKTPPAPERQLGGTSTAGDTGVLDRLRAEAQKSGDMSKVLEYKRKQKSLSK